MPSLLRACFPAGQLLCAPRQDRVGASAGAGDPVAAPEARVRVVHPLPELRLALEPAPRQGYQEMRARSLA